MTNRQKIECLDNLGFIDMIRAIAFSPWFDFVDWDKWLNSNASELDEIWKSKESKEKSTVNNLAVVEKEQVTKDADEPKKRGKRKNAFTPSDMKFCSDKVGCLIRATRNSKQIKSRDLAMQVGIAGSTLGNIETGRMKCSDSVLTAIANALGLDADELLTLYREERGAGNAEEHHDDKTTELSAMFKRAIGDDDNNVKVAAKRLGVAEYTIRHWMNGETIPGVDMTSAVVSYFRFDYDQYKEARTYAKNGICANEKPLNSTEIDLKGFGRVVQNERIRKGWSTMAVDEKLGLRSSTTVDVENGRAGVTLSMVRKYTDLFKINPDTVLKTRKKGA